MNNEDIKEILACVCGKCGDTYDLGKVVESDWSYFSTNYQEWINTAKTCLRCGKKYIPNGRILIMDNFVFEAVRRCKM